MRRRTYPVVMKFLIREAIQLLHEYCDADRHGCGIWLVGVWLLEVLVLDGRGSWYIVSKNRLLCS
jgi:hypothetical protein